MTLDGAGNWISRRRRPGRRSPDCRGDVVDPQPRGCRRWDCVSPPGGPADALGLGAYEGSFPILTVGRLRRCRTTPVGTSSSRGVHRGPGESARGDLGPKCATGNTVRRPPEHRPATGFTIQTNGGRVGLQPRARAALSRRRLSADSPRRRLRDRRGDRRICRIHARPSGVSRGPRTAW